MGKVDYEKEARELLSKLGITDPTPEQLQATIERLKKCYNYGVGYKRDRAFISKEKHERKHKRKTPGKKYKK